MPRTPPHFKVRTSVKNHVKMAVVYADPWLFSLWVKLGIEAIERFADRTGDSFILHDRELLALTGKGRADVARKLLRHLADVSPISAEPDGDVYVIHFPNLSEKHGFGQRNGTPKPPHADADADADATTPLVSPPRPRRSDKPAPRKPALERTTLFPEGGLSFPQKCELSASPSLKDITPSQFVHACQVVSDWSQSNNKRRVDWVAVVRGAINRGWALEGMPGVPHGTPSRKGSTGPPPRDRWAEERQADIDSGALRPISEIPEEELESMRQEVARVREQIGLSLGRSGRTRGQEAAEDGAGDDRTEGVD